MNGRKCDVKRRDFLKVAAAAAACPYLVSASALGLDGRPSASERIAIGAIGVGKRARMLLEQTPEAGQIVALCDCNLPRAEAFKKEKKANWAIYQDYRKVLDRKDIEAVIIATGEFQRVLPCIHACQAGKDIYAEKPLTLYIHEGRILVEAVGKHQRILQVGTQQRSMAMDCIASELVRSGGLGKVKEVLAVNYPGPDPSPAKPFPAQPVPAGLDWDIWLNQGAARSYNGEWMNWEHWRDFAGGQVTNSGAHAVDQIQAALGTDATGPVEMWLNEHKMVEMRLCQRRAAPFRARPRAGLGGACSFAKRENWRSTATSSLPTPRASPPICSRRSTKPKRKRSGRKPTKPLSGRPSGTFKTGSTASAPARNRRRTSRPAIGRSPSRTWSTSPFACSGG